MGRLAFVMNPEADQQRSQHLSPGELQTLVLTGHAASQEQDEERICTWIVDAASSLLDAPLAAVVLTPATPEGKGWVCGMVRDSPLSEPLAAGLWRRWRARRGRQR